MTGRGRRTFLRLALSGLALPFLAAAGTAQVVPKDKLMQPGSLPDKVFGDPKAPITMIEYASLACHHCADFHVKTWPELKAKYIDTGKVYFVFRDFPIDVAGLAAAMIARCAGDERWSELVDLIFKSQDKWSHAQNALVGLTDSVAQAGVSREQVDACLQDKQLAQKLEAGRDRAHRELGVSSTPTFFINGVRHRGSRTLVQLEGIFMMELMPAPR